MKALAARRRHPLAFLALVVVGLIGTGTVYSAVAPERAAASDVSEDAAAEGERLYLANCATCHGQDAAGRTGVAPSLIGVGAASVDFQVGTGRMPLRASGPQAPKNMPVFEDEQVSQMAAYIASLAPGPAIPGEEELGGEGNVSRGGELFRVNCAMCHNSTGKGGALTRGKYAPSLMGVEDKYIYEAMLTGPQAMPVFNDSVLNSEDKRDVIAYLNFVDEEPAAGGWSLGSLGPVTEGLFIWIGGLGLLIGAAVWLGAKSS